MRVIKTSGFPQLKGPGRFLIATALSSLAPALSASSVTLEPTPPLAGQPVIINYQAAGGPLANAPAVRIHLGRNDWQHLISPDPFLSESTPGVWTFAYTVPADSNQLNFVFHDGAGVWDNNLGRNWTYAVTRPPRESPTLAVTRTDGSPVTRFRYRFHQANTGEMRPYGTGIDVESPDGETTLRRPLSGMMGLEVVEVRDDGRPGGAGWTTEMVGNLATVVLRERGFLRGRLVMPPKDTPIVGVEITTTGQLDQFEEFRRDDMFDPAPVRTDAEGYFEFKGLVPRPHPIIIGDKRVQLLNPVQSHRIQPGEVTGPVIVRASAPASIGGVAIGFDGKPLRNAPVIFNIGPNQRSLTTDAEGRYMVEGVDVGWQTVWIDFPPPVGRQLRAVDVKGGTSHTLDFDFSRSVHLKAEARINGPQPPGGLNLILVSNERPNTSVVTFTIAAGTNRRLLEGMVEPGDYTWFLSSNVGLPPMTMRGNERRVLGTLSVPSEPRIGNVPLQINLQTANVRVVFPSDSTTIGGELAVYTLHDDPTTLVAHDEFPDRHLLIGRDMVVPGLVAGDYVIGYTSADGAWRGFSDPFTIAVSAPPTVTIKARDWSSAAVLPPVWLGGAAAGPQEIEFALPAGHGGKLQLRFEETAPSESGNGVVIQRVALLAGDRELARSGQIGRTFVQPYRSEYSFQTDHEGPITIKATIQRRGARASSTRLLVLKD